MMTATFWLPTVNAARKVPSTPIRAPTLARDPDVLAVVPSSYELRRLMIARPAATVAAAAPVTSSTLPTPLSTFLAVRPR